MGPNSSLYRLLQDHWEPFLGVYEEQFQHIFGALPPGCPGRFRTQGSHRSGRARFGHPAPRATGSLRDGRCCARPERAVTDSASGAIYFIVSLLLLPLLEVIAFQVGMLAGYLGFYSWYCARISYAAVNVRFLAFERSTVLAPLLVILSVAVGFLVLRI